MTVTGAGLAVDRRLIEKQELQLRTVHEVLLVVIRLRVRGIGLQPERVLERVEPDLGNPVIARGDQPVGVREARVLNQMADELDVQRQRVTVRLVPMRVELLEVEVGPPGEKRLNLHHLCSL